MAGFLGKLFKAQPGGSPAGNLLRFGLNKATNGLLGNGWFMKKKADSPTAQLDALGGLNSSPTTQAPSFWEKLTGSFNSSSTDSPMLDLNRVVKLPTVGTEVKTGMDIKVLVGLVIAAIIGAALIFRGGRH